MSIVGDLFVERLLEREKEQIIDREVIKRQTRRINKNLTFVVWFLTQFLVFTLSRSYLITHLSVKGVGSMITWIYEHAESAINCVYRLLADI